MILIVVGALRTFPKGLERGIKTVGNQRKNRDHTDLSIVKIDYNTEKSPGDLRRLAVTQIPVKNNS